MSLIKTNFEFPRGDDPQGLAKQGQRLAQDLSSNFKALDKKLTSIMTSSIPTQVLSYFDFYANNLGFGASITVAHGLGQIPTGWYVIDLTDPYGGAVGGIITRNSWDATNITLTSYYAIATITTTVSYKIRVFI